MATLFEIRIPNNFTPPALYREGAPEEIAEALALGAFVRAHVTTQRATEGLKTLAAAKDAELAARDAAAATAAAAARQDAAAAAAALREANEARQQAVAAHAEALKDMRLKERAATLREMEDRLLEMQRAADAAQRRCEAAEERRVLLEATRAGDIAAAEERTKALLQHALTLREEQVRSGQEALKALENAYRSQTDELRALNDFIRRRTTNVKVKGNEYEASFREILVRAFGVFPRFRISDTNRNGVGHAGDFLMGLGDHTVMWEVKNYDKPVPRSEVEKFQRDMLECGEDVRVGVMVSRGTEITGRCGKGDREVEFLEGKMLVYVSRFEVVAGGEEVFALQGLLPLFQIWWEVRRREEAEETEERVVQEMITDLDTLLGDLTRRRQEWRVHRSRLEETTRWMSDMVEFAEGRVDVLLRRLRMGGTGAAAAAVAAVPEGIFRPTTVDERIQDTIHCLLESFTPGEGTVRLNDLADAVAAAKKVGKDTAKKYVLAAVADTAVVAAPGKPTVVKGLVGRTMAEKN